MKRILSLDGGGIRGILTIQILRRMEALFREREGKPDLVLADVFDLFAGTSTGALIAACLCWGWSADQIDQLYEDFGRNIFTPSRGFRRFYSLYNSDRITGVFKKIFSDPQTGEPALLSTERLRKMLLVVMRNATTGSAWPVSNNTHAQFNETSSPECNLNIPLWQLIRASTAAPALFAPEEIKLGDESHMCVDGGVTPFNNPAVIAMLMATLPQYRMNWPAGRKDLHIVSVGTGGARATLAKKPVDRINIFDQLSYLVPGMINSVSTEQDVLMRVMGDCLHGELLDLELGFLDQPTLFAAVEQKFSYVRYNQRLDLEPFAGRLRKNGKATLDNLSQMPILKDIGVEYAEEHVRWEHLFPRE